MSACKPDKLSEIGKSQRQHPTRERRLKLNKQEFERQEYRLEQEICNLRDDRRREANTVHGEEERRVKASYDSSIKEIQCQLQGLKDAFYAQPADVRDPPPVSVHMTLDELITSAVNDKDYEYRKARVIKFFNKPGSTLRAFQAALLNKLINDGNEEAVRKIVDEWTLR